MGHQITGATARPFLHLLNPTRRPRQSGSRPLRVTTAYPKNAITISCAWPLAPNGKYSATWKPICRHRGPRTASLNIRGWSMPLTRQSFLTSIRLATHGRSIRLGHLQATREFDVLISERPIGIPGFPASSYPRPSWPSHVPAQPDSSCSPPSKLARPTPRQGSVGALDSCRIAK